MTLALALRQRSIPAQIFEQAHELRKLAPRSGCPQTGIRELRRLGLFDALVAVSTEPTELIYRLEGLCRTGGGRLPASGHGPQRRLRPGARSHAARPPRRLAAQAMADRYSPGWHPASTSRLLPRRIHLPLQSPQFKGPRAALSSPRPTSPRRWTRALQRHRQATGFQRIPGNGAMKGIPNHPNYSVALVLALTAIRASKPWNRLKRNT